MASAREAYRRLPNSVRRELALRRLRRWARATAYARWHNERIGQGRGTLNFYPMRPEPRMQIAWLLRALHMRIGFEIDSPAIAWDTGTWFDDRARRLLPADAINGQCLDVSKSRVDALWADVAGYSVAVDPRATSGLIVAKPEENGSHGGRLVRAPTTPRSGFVYQLLVDTRTDGRIHSTRPVIIGGDITVVLEFVRDGPNWFHGTNYCTVTTARDAYSGVEQQRIRAFAAAIGMEFGELDVFRDRHSGLIYVLDANRTPFRPSHMSRADFKRAYRAMVPAMDALIHSRAT
jgi:hypothetical protein